MRTIRQSSIQTQVSYERELAISWKAFAFYAYFGEVAFAPLRSEHKPRPQVRESYKAPLCSPKSMYRVAEKVVVCSSRYIFLVSALYLSVRRRTAQERSTSQYQVQSITAQHLRGALLNLYIHVRSC